MSADDQTVRERVGVEPTMEAMRQFFADKFGFSDNPGSSEPKVIEDLSFDGLMKHWKDKGFKNIITMVGAGISTSAGIPDFRSPGSGLYDNLQKYNLPHPQAIFEMDYFRRNPQPFFALAKELYPGTFNPTPAHYFVRMLHEKGLLTRHYTQNIDTLERIAGIPGEKLVEAHGTFYTSHCLGCRDVYTMDWVKEEIFADRVPTCIRCNGVVKPDIVFFGENMPERFYNLPTKDFKKCDLLIIMGTSLEVQPFASLIDKPKPSCLRLLINRDKVGAGSRSWFTYGPGLQYDSPENSRDVAYIGDCDDGVYAVADALGWGDELRKLVKTEHARLRVAKDTVSNDVSVGGSELELKSKESTSEIKLAKETVSDLTSLKTSGEPSAKTSEVVKAKGSTSEGGKEDDTGAAIKTSDTDEAPTEPYKKVSRSGVTFQKN